MAPQIITDSDAPKITEEQAMQLTEMIEATGANRAVFLKWLGVKKLTDLKAKFYDSAIEALRKKAEKQEQR